MEIIFRVRTCVIFNPMARGNKARHFRRHLGEMAGGAAFKATTAAGDGRRLAAEAVTEGFELVVAAGGDGTVNEVLNGIGDVEDGFERACLGVLPLGTVNVFARELGIPLKLEQAWELLHRANVRRIDLPRAEFSANGKNERRYFAQLAGAGFDARAIELVDFSVKKKIGPIAYVIAGLKALFGPKHRVTVRADGQEAVGELVLVGNGKYYGGLFEIFPAAEFADGLLDACVFKKVTWATLLRCCPALLVSKQLPESCVRRLRGADISISSADSAAFELDGEWIGRVPVKLAVERDRLRVVAPESV